MRTIALVTFVVAAVAGCEHKSKPADTGGSAAKPTPPPTTDTPPTTPPPTTPPPTTPPPTTPPPTGSDDGKTVRPPVAADLAGYVKDLPGKGNKLKAEIVTSEGTFHCELFGDKVPMTVANFVGLATGKKAWKDPSGNIQVGKPLYDGLTFHRVIPGFMIQGGDPQGTGGGGPGYKFAEEFADGLKHIPGTMSMAKTPQPGTTGSQFFINEVATEWLDGQHSVFGHCAEVDLVKKITSFGDRSGTPSKKITIDKITISRAEK
jgi:peptidyl-prolyl cis-trans isomerase A (cyclophilin A)